MTEDQRQALNTKPSSIQEGALTVVDVQASGESYRRSFWLASSLGLRAQVPVPLANSEI